MQLTDVSWTSWNLWRDTKALGFNMYLLQTSIKYCDTVMTGTEHLKTQCGNTAAYGQGE